jgi:ferredoxin
MKAIGGGNLIGDVRKALDWAFHLDFVHSFAVGMKSPSEVRVNIAWFLGQEPSPEDLCAVKREKRALHIEEWCLGCGRCVDLCGQKALYVENGRVKVNPRKCVLCGYCAKACRDFCIKVI